MIKGKINEKKNIVYIVIGVVMVYLLTAIGFQSYRLGQYRIECERYRIELQSAEDRQRELTITIDGCIDITKRADRLYSSTATTIGELKCQLKEAREIYEDMEKLLYSFYDNSCSNNYLDSSTN